MLGEGGKMNIEGGRNVGGGIYMYIHLMIHVSTYMYVCVIICTCMW